eukprot:GILK01008270.1.p1 GENE.GILK01008270.1~~GILK01008270.1.p1  ORF type:complete len:212 (-),score=19.88 GILK01008270.1:53-688(-)
MEAQMESFEQLFRDSKMASFDVVNNSLTTDVLRENKLDGRLKWRNFVYGETDTDSLLLSLQEVNPQTGETFCDLGSGYGKVVLAASLLCPGLGLCRGIELLIGPHFSALEIHKSFRTWLSENNISAAENISFEKGDFLQVDWSDTDILYLAATCFEADVLGGIVEKMPYLKSGARIISIDKPLQSDCLTLTRDVDGDMGWGDCHIFYYRRN